jgi:hypothetical protein
MSWSSHSAEMEAIAPSNNSNFINSALASRRRHVAKLLREQLKNKTRFSPVTITRGRSDSLLLDHHRNAPKVPPSSPSPLCSRMATASPPPFRTDEFAKPCTSAAPSLNSSPTNSRTHLDRALPEISPSSVRRREKPANYTMEGKMTLASEYPSSNHEDLSCCEKVEGREEQHHALAPCSLTHQESRHCSSPTVEIHAVSPEHQEYKPRTSFGKNYEKGLSVEGYNNSMGGSSPRSKNSIKSTSVYSKNNSSSISPMVITVPTITTADDNDTVLTASTTDHFHQQEDPVRDLSDKFAAIGNSPSEKRAISPLTISTYNIRSNGTSQQASNSVRGRARLYDGQRKLLTAPVQSPNLVMNFDSEAKSNKLIHHQRSSSQEEESRNSFDRVSAPMPKKLVAVPTYFTPTRCWEVTPKPQPFKPLTHKGAAATENGSTKGDDSATRTNSSKSTSSTNEFKERCRERQFEYLKNAASGRHEQKNDLVTPPSTIEQQSEISPTAPPPLLPTEYYAALSSALKINESLRQRIAYLEKELAFARQIETKSGLSQKKEKQRGYAPRNGWSYHLPSE